jgi:hypothetical protein
MIFLRFSVLLAILITSFGSTTYAQSTGKILGRIITINEIHLDGATVSLLRSKDSGIIKLSVAAKDGAYSFENIKHGKYLISATAAGHQKSFSNLFEISGAQLHVEIPVISLTPLTKSLAGVTVSAKKPLVEHRIDRTIVNVDASVTNIGTSALEVLEKSPGVIVDREGNISLKGKEGVMIMIDGRPTQLSGADLANVLRNMSSNQMDQVEIMTNPPARYDAAGNAGIINIKTKKTTTAGYNGSATVGYTQGKYPKINEGFNFNFREGKVNLFTNLSHNYRKGFESLNIQRNILGNNGNILQNYFDQEGDKIAEGNSYNAKVGVDYFANKQTTFGIVLNGTSSPSSVNNINATSISTPSKDLESITRASVDNTSDWKSFSSNLYYRRLLNTKGRELTSDLDIITYGSGNRLFMVNSYFDARNNNVRKSDTLQGYLPQDINIYSGRIDYLHPLKKNARFEAGIKSSIVRTDNNASYDSIQFGRIVHDFNRSNHFIYEENINAAYVNLSTPLSKKINAQFGLRLENTNAKGNQLTTGENFDRHYTQLFPTAYLQYKANDKNNFGINYGRRVRRPNYGSLNPFIRFIDRYTYSQGNPNLKPQLSNNFELTHSYKNLLTTTLNYTSTTDIISTVLEQKGQEAYAKPSNIASLKQFGLAVAANTPVNKWWTSNININVFNNSFEGVVNTAPIDFNATSYVLNGTQQFKLNKTLTAELTGRYRSGWIEGVLRAKPVGMLGAGFSQQVMKNQGTLRVSFRDILYTQKFRATSKYGNVDAAFQEINDTRVVSVGFTYRFSKGKKIAPVKRTSGSANEEQGRIGGDQ